MTDTNFNNNRRDPYAALRYPEFRLLFVGRLIASLGNQMLSVAIGWELWLRTHDAFSLGLIGLVQVIPVILLSLPGGHVADQYNRRKIIFITQILLFFCSLGLAYLSFIQGPLLLIYLCLLGIGVARAFNEPASATLIPQTVPPEMFTSAATWSSSSWQLASIIGPAIAGLIAAVMESVTIIYLLDAVAALVFLAMVLLIKGRPLALSPKADTLESLAEGLRFMRGNKVILAAITLDMFAVMFGGAVTLLPVYATDILHVGSQGLGLMRAAPSIGSLISAFILTHLPPMKQAGKTLLWAVAGFGLATIFFGFSTNFWLSMTMLLVLGALDNISVVIRGTLLLTRTPDEMRGRTSAVNSIFIGVSNEMGGFESGSVAALFGPIASVISGGILTILVVLGVAKIWPEIGKMTTLDGLTDEN
jgi:MFS family permease